jgi:hypothetical protein
VLLSGELAYQCGSPKEGVNGEPGGSVAVASALPAMTPGMVRLVVRVTVDKAIGNAA